MLNNLFKQLKSKHKNKHLLVVEALVENNLTFIETGEMQYKVTNAVGKHTMLFPLTGKCTIQVGNRIIAHSGTWEDTLRLLNRGIIDEKDIDSDTL
jgi:hypothetical protein